MRTLINIKRRDEQRERRRIMTYSNSPLVDYIKISPNSSNPRNKPITKITIHHAAGNLTVEQIGNIFANKERKASSNYGVDNYGRVGMYVEEKNRAWTSSNSDNDDQAVTIEVANITGAPDWKVSDIALNKTIDLCVDICKRNNIKRLNFTGDKTGNLTMHKWFAATTCPGPYLESKFPYIAEEVNKGLNSQPAVNPTPQPTQILYKVQTGAFSNKKNAEALADRLKKLGFETYIVSERKEGTAQTPAPEVRVGSRVKIIGSKYATGQTIPDWVKQKTYTVQQIAGDRALIKEIVSWVFIKDLMLI